MTQSKRPTVSVDITAKETVVAKQGNLIQKTTWDPGKGARDAEKQLSERLKAEYKRELDQYNADPTVQRLALLESKVGLLEANLIQVMKTLEEAKRG